MYIKKQYRITNNSRIIGMFLVVVQMYSTSLLLNVYSCQNVAFFKNQGSIGIFFQICFIVVVQLQYQFLIVVWYYKLVFIVRDRVEQWSTSVITQKSVISSEVFSLSRSSAIGSSGVWQWQYLGLMHSHSYLVSHDRL